MDFVTEHRVAKAGLDPALIRGDECPAGLVAQARGAEHVAEPATDTSPLLKAPTTAESATGARNSSHRSKARAGLFRLLLCKNPAWGSSPQAAMALIMSARSMP